MAVAPPDPPPPSGSCRSPPGPDPPQSRTTGEEPPRASSPCAPDAALPREEEDACGSAATNLVLTPWSSSRSSSPVLALFSSPTTVVAFEDEEDGGGFALGVGEFHVVIIFSTRTWDRRVGADICAPEIFVSASGCALGVGGFHHYHLVITFQVALHPDMGLARGRQHLRAPDRRGRIRLAQILCYTPDAGCVDLIPAPQEVEGCWHWETGEMEGNFNADQSAKEVAVLYMVPGDPAGQLHAKRDGLPRRDGPAPLSGHR